MSVERSPRGWFARLGPDRDADRRVYAFGHAGAGPGVFAPVAERLPDDVELWALHLPGRQGRPPETVPTALTDLLSSAALDVVESPVPYTLFGYCGGALLAYGIAGLTEPARLVVGGYASPDLAVIPRRLPVLPSAAFWEEIDALDGVPAELARPELRPVFEDSLRHDFGLYAEYFHDPQASPLDAPVTVVHGRDDTQVSLGERLGWKRLAARGVQWCELPTGHWVLDERPDLLAECLGAPDGDAVGAAGANRAVRT